MLLTNWRILAGSGKTILWYVNQYHFLRLFCAINVRCLEFGAYLFDRSSAAIEQVKSLNRGTPSVAVVYFYCSFDNIASQEPVSILGSFVAQLSDPFPEILNDLKDSYEQLLIPDIETQIELILKHTASLQKLFVLVDALNESYQAEAALEALLELGKRASNIRVLVSSTTWLLAPERRVNLR